VPAARLLHVPRSLSDDHAALVEPLAIAVHDVRRAQVQADDAVLVFGGGPIGTLIGLVARHRGARVVVSELNPFRLDILKGLGLETVGPETDLARFVSAWTDGAGVDVAFEVTGNPTAVRAVPSRSRRWSAAACRWRPCSRAWRTRSAAAPS
jgi:threonine dehydrogenase-like Zn-dependent dehydrogenase